MELVMLIFLPSHILGHCPKCEAFLVSFPCIPKASYDKYVFQCCYMALRLLDRIQVPENLLFQEKKRHVLRGRKFLIY
ncbi:hypothetical protein F4778DRAFT_744682 [Xylariomycetidae sp. FL2044]|nr:hypothetical protein F4778DRAFT_744682 [Xylariomycetidae sp. FL2044]